MMSTARQDNSLEPQGLPMEEVSTDVSVAQVGMDDGYADTKVALPDGRLVSIPSRARVGQAGVTWIRETAQSIFEYKTEGTVYSVGVVDGEPTQFDEYPTSGLNRVIVQHALHQAGLSGRSVHLVSGLPVGDFYRKDGRRRQTLIDQKCDSLKKTVEPLTREGHPDGSRLKTSVAFHEVIPEALAAWYDHVIDCDSDSVRLDTEKLTTPIAIVDIGGRTTDYVVVQNQAVVHGASGSLNRGLLDVKAWVSNGIEEHFDVVNIGEQRLDHAVKANTLRLHGKAYDVTDLVNSAKHELVERLYMETRRQLGQGAELDRILFVGGGSAALATDIADWFPNQTIADHAAFANARGMLKYLQYVCDDRITPGHKPDDNE